LTDTNDGSGSFAPLQLTSFGTPNFSNAPFICEDLNGDSFPDALYCTVLTGMYSKLNDGTGKFSNALLIDSSFQYYKIHVADLDNDGDNDIIWSAFTAFGPRQLGIIMNQFIDGIEENNLIEKLTVYPNPFHDYVFIDSHLPEEQICIYDSNGREIYIGLTPMKINTCSWTAGKYYINTGTISTGLIKE
jgi:hypothetical protein